ncbi:MAG: HigA family addiction module antitoxin [Treponema sp.]|nr:HigA family addiction module antitoxin [Treponema sp.]
MGEIKTILPGEILEEEFLVPMGISAYRLAKDIKISATRVSEILSGKRRITVDTALRLSKYFGNSAEFWVGIQADFEIREGRKELAGKLADIRLAEAVSA